MIEIKTIISPPQDITTTIEALPDIATLIEQPADITTQLIFGQGPAGPPGSGGSASNVILHSDYSGPDYFYLGYASRVARIDYSTSPSTILTCATTNIELDWPNRSTLAYI